MATALGERIVDLVHDPDAFVSALKEGFETLADPAVVSGIRIVAPGIGPVLGVRLPLMDVTHKAFKRGTRKTPTSLLVDAMDHLMRQELREIRWFGMWNLERLLPTDPERTWQLMRRGAAEADEWITVDTLAHSYGAGILRDPRRWSELELLVYSPSRWERRLVGSTIATLPHVKLAGSRDLVVAARGLELIGQLIGDSDSDVQKALSWALRTLAAIDPTATLTFVERETAEACRIEDGHRAWVLRDTLSKLPEGAQARLRDQLAGIRRRPGAPSTSRAATSAVEFASAGAASRPANSSREE
jgi:3-methyladenine DNA glycosylase AlkD